jgi:NADPH2:quinone reductase
MRGIGVIEFGDPEVLRVVGLPEVHAGPGEMRIRVHAASANPTDIFHRNGTRAGPSWGQFASCRPRWIRQ